jgi:hypothetical protein
VLPWSSRGPSTNLLRGKQIVSGSPKARMGSGKSVSGEPRTVEGMGAQQRQAGWYGQLRASGGDDGLRPASPVSPGSV